MKIEGVVENILTRSVNTKNGPGTVYTAIVNGEEVDLGFKKEYEVGALFSAECEKKYGKWKPGASVSAPHVKYGATSGAGGRTHMGKPFPLPSEHGDNSIIRQNSLTNANATISAYLSVAKPAGDLNDTVQDVLKIARLYAEFSSGRMNDEELSEE